MSIASKLSISIRNEDMSFDNNRTPTALVVATMGTLVSVKCITGESSMNCSGSRRIAENAAIITDCRIT